MGFTFLGTSYLSLVKPVGYTKPPGKEIGSARHALNAHTYCCQLNFHICGDDGELDPKEAHLCLPYHFRRLGQRDEDARRLGVPMVVSEFAACGNSDGCALEITSITDVCENYLTSWAQW